MVSNKRSRAFAKHYTPRGRIAKAQAALGLPGLYLWQGRQDLNPQPTVLECVTRRFITCQRMPQSLEPQQVPGFGFRFHVGAD